MELIIGVVVLAVLIPLGIWFGDEAGGRAAWRQVIDVREHHALGLGAFRAAEVEVAHSAVLRERAPWWVRHSAGFSWRFPLWLRCSAVR